MEEGGYMKLKEKLEKEFINKKVQVQTLKDVKSGVEVTQVGDDYILVKEKGEEIIYNLQTILSVKLWKQPVSSYGAS